jgi:hypothetical protein
MSTILVSYCQKTHLQEKAMEYQLELKKTNTGILILRKDNLS